MKSAMRVDSEGLQRASHLIMSDNTIVFKIELSYFPTDEE